MASGGVAAAAAGPLVYAHLRAQDTDGADDGTPAAATPTPAPRAPTPGADAGDGTPAAAKAGAPTGGGAGGSVTNPLRRQLGTLDMTLIGVAAIIGAGVFVLSGQAAARYAGPAVVLSFIISGVVCGFSALCYSELGAMVTGSSGSAYAFATATIGPFGGWVIGWDLALEYLMGSATGAWCCVGDAAPA
jgi:hypothetical protein